MAKLPKSVLSLTAAGTASKLSGFAQNAANRELATLIEKAVQACDRTQSTYTDILGGIEKARADRRRTEFGREHFAAELADRLHKVALADLQTFVEWLGETEQKQDKQVKGMFIEVSDNDRFQNTELRRLVREKCKTPASVAVMLSKSDAAIGKAVLSAHLMLSGSSEDQRGKLVDMYLAKHEPQLHGEMGAVQQASEMVNETGQALISKVHESVDMKILNVDAA